MSRRAASPGKARLSELVDRLATARVGVVGDVVADIYVTGQTQRVSREAPVVILRHERQWLLPGGAANVAANAARLGVSVQLVGLVGCDEPGQQVLAALERAGVAAEGVVASGQQATTTKTRFLAGARHTSRQQVLRVDREPAGPPSDSLRALLRERVERLDERVGTWIVSDYGYGLFDEAFKRLLAAVARGKTVVADSRFDARGFTGVTVIKPNEEEAIAATSATDGSPQQMEQAARELAESLGLEAVLITLGNQGMLLYSNDGQAELIPAVGPDQIVDLTGAGDTVAAVFTAALAAGANMSEAAHLANVAGGIVVMREGVSTVSPAELKAAIQQSDL
ncbi:MAG: bifunctional heptose 7-phosphate kinase/heptose 1-phosphate adenyltransferase [Phycisphaerae bacterium]